MGLITIRLEVNGQEQTKMLGIGRGNIEGALGFEGIRRRQKDIAPIGPAVHGILLEESKGIRDSQGSSIGQPWAAYTDAERRRYTPWKSRKGGGNSVMRWAYGERLWPSLTEPGHAEHHWRQNATTFEFGTSVPYAKGHNDGTGYAAKWMGGYRLPMRKLIGVSSEGFARVQRTIQRYVMSGDTSSSGVRSRS